MAVLLDRRWQIRGASRPASKKRKRILSGMPQRVETGYDQWQSDCHFCNRHKGPNLAGIDPDTESVVELFHPRKQDWTEHFEFQGPYIVGKTGTGRTTVQVLAMNDTLRVEL